MDRATRISVGLLVFAWVVILTGYGIYLIIYKPVIEDMVL